VNAQGQQGSGSPYSAYGFGDLFNNTQITQSLMGVSGIGASDLFSVASVNPASYVGIARPVFEAGGVGRFITYELDGVTGKGQRTDLLGLSIGVPFAKNKWGFALGVAPFSNVGYQINNYDTLIATGGRVRYEYSGSGGLNKAFLGLSRVLWQTNDSMERGKKLSFGANINYLFGTVEEARKAYYPTNGNFYNSQVTSSLVVRAPTVNLGFQFTGDLVQKERVAVSFAERRLELLAKDERLQGDGGDSSFDSAVFLEAGSFTSAGEVTATLTGGTGLNGTDLVEGCGPWDFVFTRVGELDQDVTIDLAVSGTSTAGVDYMPLFPTQINFPANVDQVTISIDASLDMDGDETLIMDVEQLLQCANVVVQSQFIFNIVSHPELDVQLTDVNSVCNQQNTLTPTVTGGTGVYSYLWNTGETTASINVTPGVTTSYDVTVSEACGVDPVTETVTVTLPIYDPLDIDVSPATEIVCLEDGDISVLSATGGDGDFTYEWTANGAVVGATATIQVPGGPPQWYFVTVSEGCGTSTMDSVLVSAVVNEPIVITTSPDLTVLCAGDTALLQVIDITGGGGIYTLIWEDPNGVQLSTAYDLTVGVPADQTYTITATDQCETEGTATVSTSIPQYAPLQLTMPADMRLCAGDSVALVPSISGASGYYYITWADLDITDPVFTVMPNEQTVYTMTVRDECGEELTDNVTIEVEHVQIDIVTTNHGQDDWHVEAATVPYAQTWVWDMGDGTRSRGFEAFHSYMDLDEHMVTLEITTPNGCAATDSVLLRPPGHIYFANAFTPDGDGINDIWGPKGHYIEQFELTIFDRWGSQVFSTKEMDITWDGTINGGGKAPTGVYVYKYRAEGHLFPSTEGYGHVTLLAGSQN